MAFYLSVGSNRPNWVQSAHRLTSFQNIKSKVEETGRAMVTWLYFFRKYFLPIVRIGRRYTL